MTLPASPTPARKAVIAALTTTLSLPRSIGAAYLFRQATPSAVHQNPSDCKKQPRCFVLFRDPVLDGEMENGSIVTTHYVVQVSLFYWMGSELIATEVNAQLERIEADMNRVRAALCYPGALELDPDGADTGLDGQALRSDGWRAAGPDPFPTTSPNDQRVLRVVHTFRASIDVLQP